jgi:hypothetical protein
MPLAKDKEMSYAIIALLIFMSAKYDEPSKQGSDELTIELKD